MEAMFQRQQRGKEVLLSVRPSEFCRAQPCDHENLRHLQAEYKAKFMVASLINLVKPNKQQRKHCHGYQMTIQAERFRLSRMASMEAVEHELGCSLLP